MNLILIILIVLILRHHLQMEQHRIPFGISLSPEIRRLVFTNVRKRGGIVLL